MRWKTISEEVLYGDEPIIKVSSDDIQNLKHLAMKNRRKRIRLCAHRDEEDKVHEMLIVHTSDTYVRPHKHLTKSESFHIIEGRADVILFDDAGNVVNVVPMGDPSSGHSFYYRISDPYFHSLQIHSDFLVFHETANGPFRRSDNVSAPWSPDESDSGAVRDFAASLAQSIGGFAPECHATS